MTYPGFFELVLIFEKRLSCLSHFLNGIYHPIIHAQQAICPLSTE